MFWSKMKSPEVLAEEYKELSSCVISLHIETSSASLITPNKIFTKIESILKYRDTLKYHGNTKSSPLTVGLISVWVEDDSVRIKRQLSQYEIDPSRR